MATRSVSLPDDLDAWLRENKDVLNISQAAVNAWEREREMDEQLKDAGEISVEVGEDTLVFTGKAIERGDSVEIYLKDDDEILLIDTDREDYSVVPIPEVDSEMVEGWFPYDREAYNTVCSALGIRRIVRL